MIVVRMELWPGGFEEAKETLGVAVITNDITGSHTKGNYRYRLGKRGVSDISEVMNTPGKQFRNGRIRGFPRKRLLAWDLLCRILNDAVGGRNGV